MYVLLHWFGHEFARLTDGAATMYTLAVKNGNRLQSIYINNPPFNCMTCIWNMPLASTNLSIANCQMARRSNYTLVGWKIRTEWRCEFVLIGKSLTNGSCSIAMFDYRRVDNLRMNMSPWPQPSPECHRHAEPEGHARTMVTCHG